MEYSIGHLLDEAVDSHSDHGRLFSGATLAYTNQDDTTTFTKSAGTLSVASTTPVDQNSLVWVASFTKLPTAIAALQLVQRGDLSLDSSEQVSRLLPELASLDLIQNFDPDSKKFDIAKASRPPTLRELLTHTSGFQYDMLSPQLQAWRASRGEAPKWLDLDVVDSYIHPLVCEPGTGWSYGPGFDWAGKLIERQSAMSLGEFLSKNIFEPLGLSRTTFHPEKRSDLKDTLLEACSRANKNNALEDNAPPLMWTKLASGGGDDRGGVGLYSTAAEYLKILTSLLRNDGVLLKPDTVDLLFKPQCHGKTKADIQETLGGWLGPAIFPGLPVTADLNYSMGGAVLDSDVEGFAKEGAVTWAGLPHCSWLIERRLGYCAAFLCSYVPSGDAKITNLIKNLFNKLHLHQQ